MEDASLEEFLGAEDGAGEPDEPEAGAAPAQRAPPSTFAFVSEGAACTACGAAVTRRWRDEAGLVCPDCKDW